MMVVQGLRGASFRFGLLLVLKEARSYHGYSLYLLTYKRAEAIAIAMSVHVCFVCPFPVLFHLHLFPP